MIRWIIAWTVLVILAGCTPVQTGKKSDQDFEQALANSEKAKNEKLDFLKDEKLPNEEYIVTDSVKATADSDEYGEIPPTLPAKYRIQIFAGSAVNAHKTYNQYVSRWSSTEAYVIRDPATDRWKVWVGNYPNKPAADSIKVMLQQNGYPDAWVAEMPVQLPVKETRTELFWVQIGSFSNQSSAMNVQQSLGSKLKEKVIIKSVSGAYKVWIGGYTERSQADALKNQLKTEGHQGAFVVQGLE